MTIFEHITRNLSSCNGRVAALYAMLSPLVLWAAAELYITVAHRELYSSLDHDPNPMLAFALLGDTILIFGSVVIGCVLGLLLAVISVRVSKRIGVWQWFAFGINGAPLALAGLLVLVAFVHHW